MKHCDDGIFIGEKIVAMDYKSRIIIPAQFRIEQQAELVMQKHAIDNEIALKISLYSDFKRLLEAYNRIINGTLSYEELENARKQIELMCTSLMGRCEMDRQGRITIPKDFIKESGWAKGDYTINGIGNALVVRKRSLK